MLNASTLVLGDDGKDNRNALLFLNNNQNKNSLAWINSTMVTTENIISELKDREI